VRRRAARHYQTRESEVLDGALGRVVRLLAQGLAPPRLVQRRPIPPPRRTQRGRPFRRLALVIVSPERRRGDVLGKEGPWKSNRMRRTACSIMTNSTTLSQTWTTRAW